MFNVRLNNRSQRRRHAKTTGTQLVKQRPSQTVRPSLDPLQDLVRSADALYCGQLGDRRVEWYASEEAVERILNDPDGRQSWEVHARFDAWGYAGGALWVGVETALENAIWRRTRRVYRFSALASGQLAATDIDEVPAEMLALLPSPVLLLIFGGRAFSVLVRRPWVQITELFGRDASLGAEVVLRMDQELTEANIAYCTQFEVDHGAVAVPKRLPTATTKEVLKHLLYLCVRPVVPPTSTTARPSQPSAPLCVFVRQAGEPDDIPTTRFTRPNDRPLTEARADSTGERHVRPHFRRGHFSHRWHGTERDGNRHRVLHWIKSRAPLDQADPRGRRRAAGARRRRGRVGDEVTGPGLHVDLVPRRDQVADHRWRATPGH